MTRPGSGEFDTPDGRFTRDHFQRVFLYRASELVPELKRSLAESIRTLPAETFDYPPFSVWADEYETNRLIDEGAARLERITACIEPCLRALHLTEPWVSFHLRFHMAGMPIHLADGRPELISVVLDTVFERVRPSKSDSPLYPPDRPSFVDGRSWIDNIDPQPDDFVFSARWYPQEEYRADITRWLRDRFDRELDEYLDATERKMVEAGLVRTPEKRARRGGEPTQHFDWLVRFQLLSRSHERIAREAGVAEKTVAAGCRSAAELIDLTRRSVR